MSTLGDKYLDAIYPQIVESYGKYEKEKFTKEQIKKYLESKQPKTER